MKARCEPFGGIISLENPPALLFVDKEFMKSLGYASELWNIKQTYLSAPTEVHFSITNECPMGCSNCYVAAGKKLPNELTTDELKKSIDLLSEMGVFHIAFGGGEPFARRDFLELAGYARGAEIVPNVTTNGYYITEEIAKRCRIFGQINVSMDGIGKKYEEVRGIDGFKIADRAIGLLVGAECKVGINCLISRKNFDHLPELVRYAELKGCNEIMLLRFKPSGRGSKLYEKMKLTPEQNERFFSLLRDLSLTHEISIKTDCSFVPLICYHEPEKERLEFLSISGCEGGNSLAGITPTGKFSACSFCRSSGGHIFEFKEKWHVSDHLKNFRKWISRAPEPCKLCEYLSICRGGCHVVAEFVFGDFFAPDPECPKVNSSLNSTCVSSKF